MKLEVWSPETGFLDWGIAYVTQNRKHAHGTLALVSLGSSLSPGRGRASPPRAEFGRVLPGESDRLCRFFIGDFRG